MTRIANPFAPPFSLDRPAARSSDAGQWIIGLFLLRWAAGIGENFGVPALSQAAALVMLAGLAILFLNRLTITENSTTLMSGAVAWISSGTLSFIANPEADVMNTLSLLSLLALYALFANATMNSLATPAGARRIYLALGIFLLVGAALSVSQIATGHGFVEAGKHRIQRAFGSDVHPVSFGIQVVGALVALEIARVRLRLRFSLGHGVVMAAGLLALYLTYARTAWVMALLCAAAAFVLRGSWARRLTLGTVGLALAIVALASSSRFADLASLPTFFENFSPSDLVFDWRYIDNSVSWRIVNWSYGLQQALERPFLGFGPGQSALSSHFNLEMHNIFLEALFEGGFFGLLALLLALAGLVRLHRALPSGTGRDNYTATLANSFGVALLLAVTFSTSFVDQLMSFLIYILMLGTAMSCAAAPAAMRHRGRNWRLQPGAMRCK